MNRGSWVGRRLWPGRVLRVISQAPVWGAALVGGLALSVLGETMPRVAGVLPPTSIHTDGGLAHVVGMARLAWYPYLVRGPYVGSTAVGHLVLFENGVLLGPADAPGDLLRQQGGGAYTMWGTTLYFSSSDGSDPARNGRVYAYRGRAGLDPALRPLAAALFMLAVIGWMGHVARSPGVRGSGLTRPAGPALAGLGGLVLLLLFAASIMVPARWATLRPETITGGRGLAHQARIPREPSEVRRAVFEDWTGDTGSRRRLREGDGLLGSPVGDPRMVADHGAGRYWQHGDYLAMSSSDGTDPRLNGRRYAWRVPVRVRVSAWLVASAALMVGLAFGCPGAAATAGAWLTAAAGPAGRPETVSGALPGLALVLGCGGLGVVLLLQQWAGSSGHLGVAGYLPVSDAFRYFSCAVGIAGLDSIIVPVSLTDFCGRRTIYPTMLGSALALTGWRPDLVLLAQAGMLGASIGCVTVVVARTVSRLAALVVAVGLFAFARELAIGTFMTEVAGLSAGLTGLALLLAYAAAPRRPALLLAGLSLVSLGMAARAGSLSVVPALAVWGYVEARRAGRLPRLLAGLVVLAASAAGPILMLVQGLGLGLASHNSGGNFATSLYGLSTGSRDWSQAYRDFGALFVSQPESTGFRVVSDAALQNIARHPLVFLGSLVEAGHVYLTTLYDFDVLRRLNWVLSVLTLVGAGRCLLGLRQPHLALLLSMGIGELATAPLVIDSGGPRVLAASVGGRVALAGVGVTWLLQLARQAWPGGGAVTSGEPARLRPGAGGAGVLAVILVGAAILPLTPVTRLVRLTPITGQGCPGDLEEVVARIGAESMALAIGPPSTPLVGRALVLAPGRLEEDPGRQRTWWGNRLPDLPSGSVLIYAIQRSPRSLGQLVPVLWHRDLPGSRDEPLSLCVSTRPSGVWLGGSMMRPASSVTLLKR